GVVAAALAAHQHVVGDDVGGVAGGSAVGAADGADVAGAGTPVLHDFAEPAAGADGRQRLGQDHGRADAALRCAAGVRGPADDLGLPAVRADRADDDVGRRPAVVVEAHLDATEVRWVQVAGT